MAKHTIDATDKILGRLATEVSVLLRGKNSAEFLPYVDSGNFVNVINIDKIKVSGNKESTKPYWRYTGYPGGIRKIIYKDLPSDDPTQRRPDIGKASKKLSWKPSIGLEEGLIKTIEYFKNQTSL